MIHENDIDDTRLDEVDLFSSKAEIVNYLILKYLLNKSDPVGSWVLKVMLELKNVIVSTATIGRLLKNLDAKGYTKLVEAQGRVITSKGAAYITKLSEKVQREQLQKQVMNAAQPQNYSELLDLMRTRKVLECETARLAALRANSANITVLERTITRHEMCLDNCSDPSAPALDFHGKVAEASNLRFLIASLNILVYEELNLGTQLVQITRERSAEYVQQHKRIADAIKKGDPGEAEHQMRLHMDEMIKDVEDQIKKLKLM
ncbi:FCD domain-containing protein [Paenibacillus sp. sgz302251]|uniref:FadR/GntR family transcriptional regulator n=1 Tax=Paenibacillus sp. sgz302251 TaxID=3414493 RepID=UPI003C7E03CF